MMKLPLYLLTILSFLIYPNTTTGQCELEVEIKNLRSNSGFILLAVFDSSQKSIRSEKIAVQDKKCVIAIEEFKPSKYAVRYAFDENSNDKIDTNWTGIPTEGYGVSNNTYGIFGPLTFDK